MKDYLESAYKKFQDFTIDEHLCDEDVKYICERWLMDANLTEYLSYRNKREKDKEKARERAKQWRQANPEKSREYGKKYYKDKISHVGKTESIP
jgi:hypothetical protein